MAKNNKGSQSNLQSSAQSASQSDSQSVAQKNSEKTEAGVDSRSIIIAGVVILLLLAGIGFLILGLAQSINSGRVDDAGIARQSDDLAAAEVNPNGADSNGDSNRASRSDANDSASTGGSNDSGDNGGTSVGSNVGSSVDSNSGGNNNSAGSEGRPSQGDFKATSSTYRRGNTYKFGDITGDNYQVRKGDTLWQIAQGRYGSGYAWTVIDDANGGFPLLKNGTPNNIPVGYNLILPQI